MQTSVAISIAKSICTKLQIMLAGDSTCPPPVRQQIGREMEAINCLIEKVKANFDHLVIVIGHPELVEPIIKDKVESTTIGSKDGNTIAIIIEPPTEFIDENKKRFNPDDWKGNEFPPAAAPENVYCERYYAAQQDKKKVIFFEVDVENQWSAVTLSSWADVIFKNVKWTN